MAVMVRDERAVRVSAKGQSKTFEQLPRAVPSKAIGQPFESRFKFFLKRAADKRVSSVGADEKKDSPLDVAAVGYEAMMRGDGDVVSGWRNKLQTVMANVTPSGMLAEQHRKQAEPGSAKK